MHPPSFPSKFYPFLCLPPHDCSSCICLYIVPLIFIDFETKRHTLKNNAYTSNVQPVNSDLRPFHEEKDHVLCFLACWAWRSRPIVLDSLGFLQNHFICIVYNLYIYIWHVFCYISIYLLYIPKGTQLRQLQGGCFGVVRTSFLEGHVKFPTVFLRMTCGSCCPCQLQTPSNQSRRPMGPPGKDEGLCLDCPAPPRLLNRDGLINNQYLIRSR